MPKGVKYGKWTTETMKREIAAFRNGDMWLNEVCQQYGVPKATLKSHLEGKNNFAAEGKQIVGSLGDIPPEKEQELVNYVLKLEESFFGITSKDLRELAFQAADRNNMSHRFNKEKMSAGKNGTIILCDGTPK